LADLRRHADALAGFLREVDGLASVDVSEDVAYVGGGSLPDQALKTCVVEIEARNLSETELAYRLRIGQPAVIGRLRENKLVLDVRTILPKQEELIVQAIRQAIRQ
jgi:L-seryl-tRNA(Ser) seleniumtransferase